METKKLGSASSVSAKIVGKARIEKSAQLRLEVMQKSIEKGEITPAAITASIEKELERFKKNRQGLKNQPLSDFSALRRMSEEEFKHATREELLADQAKMAARFVDRITDPNQKQIALVSQYYAQKAEKSWSIIQQVRALLKRVDELSKVKVTAPVEGAPVEA